MLVTSWLAACAAYQPLIPEDYADEQAYLAARERLIAAERALRFDAALELTPAEEAANARLMALKQAERQRTQGYFPPAHSFLLAETRRMMEASPVLPVMRRLPKGGILHGHGAALGDFRWLVAEATYRPDCYTYSGTGSEAVTGALLISDDHPGKGWQRVVDLRRAASDADAFDEQI